MKTAIYPRSNAGWIYAALVTVPMAGAFAALLFYEWFGNDSPLADATMLATEAMTAYSVAVIGWKAAVLCYVRKRALALSRLAVALKAFLANAAAIGCYRAWRFMSA